MASEHDVMPSSAPGESQTTITTRGMELFLSGFLMVVAGFVMYDSVRVGNGWASDGPEAGYFPFYVGLIMFLASAGTFAVNLLTRKPDLSNFVARSSLVLVLKVLAPTFVYLGVMYFIGIYVASILYIGLFMMWLGKYSLAKTVPIAVLIPLALFWLFEIAFLIPLPKGPLETALGF
ncbi:MAG TPA: tripartite tricarboxylate transporter TctB family protein [Rhizobiaceae bacterium]